MYFPFSPDTDVYLIYLIAHAVFKTPSAAMRAVEKLHAHIFKGSLLSVALKKRVDSVTKPGKVAKPGDHAVAPSRASRLIVRNLPWDVSLIFSIYRLYISNVPT